MINTITVFYFHGAPLPNLKFKHKEVFLYSRRKRNQIVDKIIDAGYNVLIQTILAEGSQVIFIDKYRFQQR